MQASSPVQVVIAADGRRLEGELIVPGDASGVVAFAHGSGSSRHSPRNRTLDGNDPGFRLGPWTGSRAAISLEGR